MSENNGPKVVGCGLPEILLVIFVVLKLTDVIDWSWIWVLSPFWISIIIGFILGIGAALGKNGQL